MQGPQIITLRGDVDVGTVRDHADRLDEQLAGRTEHVILDLTDVGALDSTGLSMLIGTMRRLNRTRRRLAVVPAADGGVSRALEATGLVHVFEVHASVDDAVAALAAAPPVGR